MPHPCGAAAWKWPNSRRRHSCRRLLATPCYSPEQVSRRVSTPQARVPAPHGRVLEMGANSRTVALIGSETLLAREVRDVVAPGGGDCGLGVVGRVGEEPGALARVGDKASRV